MLKNKTLHPFESFRLERRWFKDTTEFDFICKTLGIDEEEIEEVGEIEVSCDQLDFDVEVDEEETVDA